MAVMPWWGVALVVAGTVVVVSVAAYLLYMWWAYRSFSHPGD